MKPGPLTVEERSMIERIPELGERILAPIDQLEAVRPIVAACHERYDGLGYPDGLKADEIPLEARIIFAVRRVPRDDDRPALPRGAPRRGGVPAPRRGRGTQFDPVVVEVCLRVLKQPPPAAD
jgi:HD-GYP domain-containing protein (c-di-GMP phosphodiesterase class II)